MIGRLGQQVRYVVKIFRKSEPAFSDSFISMKNSVQETTKTVGEIVNLIRGLEPSTVPESLDDI